MTANSKLTYQSPKMEAALLKAGGVLCVSADFDFPNPFSGNTETPW